MAILSYPIFFYRSKTEMEMNFGRDLNVLGVKPNDIIEKAIQEKMVFPHTHFTVLVTKIIRQSV
jgi:hypothetical protein